LPSRTLAFAAKIGEYGRCIRRGESYRAWRFFHADLAAATLIYIAVAWAGVKATALSALASSEAPMALIFSSLTGAAGAASFATLSLFEIFR